MTMYECIKDFDEDEMADFLYAFANDIINDFAMFIFPSKDSMKNFLKKEISYK